MLILISISPAGKASTIMIIIMIHLRFWLWLWFSRESIYAPPPSANHQQRQCRTSPSPSEGKASLVSPKNTSRRAPHDSEVNLVGLFFFAFPISQWTSPFDILLPQVQILGVAKRSSEPDGEFSQIRWRLNCDHNNYQSWDKSSNLNEREQREKAKENWGSRGLE